MAGCSLLVDRVSLWSNTLAIAGGQAIYSDRGKPPLDATGANMQASSAPVHSAPFDLPPFHAEVRAQAQELAARFAQHARDVRTHPFEHGELHPQLWREIRERGWPGLLVAPAYGGSDGGLLGYVTIIEATRLLVYRAAHMLDAGAETMAVAGEANIAKLLSADLLFDAADHAMQTLGAQAWDEREGMIDLYLDARAARSAPISQELALNFIAQHVLGLPSHR
jgi:alkylation response protein AidB-like acyl-CoA dehydrogenase